MPFKNKTVRRHNIGVSIIYTCVASIMYVSKQHNRSHISVRLESIVRTNVAFASTNKIQKSWCKRQRLSSRIASVERAFERKRQGVSKTS